MAAISSKKAYSLQSAMLLPLLDMLTSQQVGLPQDNAGVIVNPKGGMKGTGLVAKSCVCLLADPVVVIG